MRRWVHCGKDGKVRSPGQAALAPRFPSYFCLIRCHQDTVVCDGLQVYRAAAGPSALGGPAGRKGQAWVPRTSQRVMHCRSVLLCVSRWRADWEEAGKDFSSHSSSSFPGSHL